MFLFDFISQLQFIDTFIERQPKLRRQRCIFTKERGTHRQPAGLRDFLVYVFLFVQGVTVSM